MDNPPDDGPCEITVTAPDREWLQGFVRQLVDDRLVAAAHVDLMAMNYRWSGEVQQAEEARAVLHSRRGAVAAISRRARDTHPYDVPCVAAVAVVGGDPSYLEWMVAESGGSRWSR